MAIARPVRSSPKVGLVTLFLKVRAKAHHDDQAQADARIRSTRVNMLTASAA